MLLRERVRKYESADTTLLHTHNRVDEIKECVFFTELNWDDVMEKKVLYMQLILYCYYIISTLPH